MVSQNKLIKEGIRYTDALFDEISKRLEQGVRSSDTLEEFLEKTKEYTTANPLATSEYDKTMLNLILSETNNHRFSRPAQKELVRVTIEEKVGEKIHDVGEDIKDSVRDIVKYGYNNNLSQDKIAENISDRVSSIKNRRARAIARTEIARAATVSDYVINKERGATGWYVECRNTACPICKNAWHKKWTPETDDSFNPSDKTAGGKGWVGDKIYSMEDTQSLPPIHPNCYDSETKVFTDNGWKYFKDVTVTDKFLSLNPMTNETEFLEPVKLIEVPNVHGKLYHIHNKWFDVCVTPDHDCFIHQRRDGGNRGKYFEPQFRKPSELSSESRFVRCIDTDRENPKTVNVNGLEFTPEDYAFFMAWYISEGSVLHNPETAKSKNYPIKITQEIDANREIIEPVFCNIADYLGIKLYIGKQYFEFHSKALHDYLVQLGKSHEKYIPKEVFTLNKECLNIFLDVYVLGDGHERTESNSLVNNGNERILFTSSKRLRDDLSYLILLCGYYPSIGIHTKAGTVSNHRNGKYVQNHDVYRISINKSKYTIFSSCTVDEIEYSDLVYCVELPKYHTLWVMRNGKTSWNGNCRCVVYYIADSKGKVSTKPFTKPATETQSYSLPFEANNKLLQSNYEKYEETTEHGRKLDVYKFENIEIGIEKGSKFTFEDMVSHLNSLPKEFVENTHAKRINIASTKNLESEHAYGAGNVAGFYNVGKGEVYVFEGGSRSKEYIKDVFNHEYSHSRDLNRERKNTLANPEIYEKYVQADNVYGISNPTAVDRLTYKAPTEYAGRSYLREKYGSTPEARYTEDIADSSKQYLNPHTHSQFVKEFPNRAKYFEEVYGKPDFDKITYSKRGFEGEQSTRVIAKQDIDKLETQYKTKLYDITNQLEELKIKRNEYRDKSYENEEEYDKWNSKYRETRVEMKRLKRVKDELEGELYFISSAKERAF